MKKVAFLIVLFISVTEIHAQCDSSLIGNWRVVSVKTEDGFFNFLTDSMSVFPGAYNNGADSAKQALMDIHKMMYGSIEFDFTTASKLSMRFMGELMINDTKYCFNKKSNLIMVTSQNSLGEYITDEWPGHIKDGLLFITMSVKGDTQEEAPTFTLQKMPKLGKMPENRHLP